MLVVLLLFVVFVIDYLYLQVTPIKGAGMCADCIPKTDGFDCKSLQEKGGQTCTVSGDGQHCHLTGPCGAPPSAD